MILFKKAKLFWSFNFFTKKLLIEAWLYLGWARAFKSMQFKKVANYLGEPMAETSYCIDELNKKVIMNISEAINLMSRHTFWETMCMVKAIAAMKMLEKRRIESTIYFGTTKDSEGKIQAHAWLRSGPYYVTGFEEKHLFTVVGKFANKIRNERVEGEKND